MTEARRTIFEYWDNFIRLSGSTWAIYYGDSYMDEPVLKRFMWRRETTFSRFARNHGTRKRYDYEARRGHFPPSPITNY